MILQFTSVVIFAMALGAQSAAESRCRGLPPASGQEPLLTVIDSRSLVVVAQITSYSGEHATEPGMPDAMVVQVMEVLQGSLSARQLRVRVNEGLHPPYVAAFPIGTSWVLHLYSSRKTPSEYWISSSGEHWLPIEAGQVRGCIVQGPYNAPEITMPLSELRRRFEGIAAGHKTMEDLWKSKAKD